MPQTVKGVVAMEQDAPVTIENIIIPDPGPGEARGQTLIERIDGLENLAAAIELIDLLRI